jgi:predicted DsbA family dithiol-disulfide isomerase
LSEQRIEAAPVHVEIWSDIVCPWCYVGKRRFEAALASFEHRDEVSVTWRSFELDPDAPRVRDVDAATHLASKYGMTREEAQARQQSLADTAAGDGLDLRFDLARGGNSFDGHRLIHLAEAHGIQDAMKERLMRAYFTEGQAIGEQEVLAGLAGETGLAEDEARDVLGSDRYADAVRVDESTAMNLGITAVPFFVVDRRMGAAGAHPPEALLELLRQGWAARPAAEPLPGAAAPGA